VAVKLSSRDRRLLDGAHGEAAQLAMSIVTRMAEVYGADELMDISQAHIDACGFVSESGLEFAERLVALGARVAVPSTLNMVPLDLQNWESLGMPEQHAHQAKRLAQAYLDMGCIPTWTCAPYQGYLTPRFGQQIVSGESNAIVYANSVLGARTNRYGDYIDICAAITGRAPRCGLHLKANRRGQVLVRVDQLPPAVFEDESFYPVLGYLLGHAVQDKVPVIQGLPGGVTGDQLKALGAASASSGAVSLYHVVGVTPEAPTREAAFHGGEPDRVMEIDFTDLARAWADLSTVEEGARLDAVVLGCPHFSYAEFEQLAEAIERQGNQPVAPHVRFLILTSQTSYGLLRRSRLIEPILSFGAEIILDTCTLCAPVLSSNTSVIMTNSAKQAYYTPGELSAGVGFGSTRDCVRSAVQGVICRDPRPWSES
jgi:predicted aconitase